VAYYVPLGPRGLLIGAGTFLLHLWGGLVYEILRRRRVILPADVPLPIGFADLMAAD
jgi:hypothetical protein